jgi:hypothetical protein
MCSAASYSPTAAAAVPSALEGLTAEFGMGSGVPPPPKPLSTSDGSMWEVRLCAYALFNAAAERGSPHPESCIAIEIDVEQKSKTSGD